MVTEVSFRMELTTATIDVAESQFNLTDFLSLSDFGEDQHAQSGEMIRHINALVTVVGSFVELTNNL